MASSLKAEDARKLDDAALAKKLKEAKEELFNLRFQVATGQLTNNAQLKSVRREIARIYTILREREIGIDLGPVKDGESA